MQCSDLELPTFSETLTEMLYLARPRTSTDTNSKRKYKSDKARSDLPEWNTPAQKLTEPEFYDTKLRRRKKTMRPSRCNFLQPQEELQVGLRPPYRITLAVLTIASTSSSSSAGCPC